MEPSFAIRLYSIILITACLGVAQDLFGDWDNYNGDFETCYLLDEKLNEELGLLTYEDSELQEDETNMNLILTNLNDFEGYTFAQIADYIEENILNKVN